MNWWIGIGKVFHTPQFSYAGTPRRKLRLSVATVSVFDDGGEETQLHNVVLHGILADIWAPKLLKTDVIGVTGEVNYHQKKDGTKRVMEIKAIKIELIARASEQFDRDDNTPF